MTDRPYDSFMAVGAMQEVATRLFGLADQLEKLGQDLAKHSDALYIKLESQYPVPPEEERNA